MHVLLKEIGSVKVESKETETFTIYKQIYYLFL